MAAKAGDQAEALTLDEICFPLSESSKQLSLS